MSSTAGGSVSSVSGLTVVDLRLVKMFLILSCSFLVFSLGVVRGVLTVVDLARPGRLLKRLPGLRDGTNRPDLLGLEDSTEDSVVVIPGVMSRSITVVALGLAEIPDLEVDLLGREEEGVVLRGGSLGGWRVETGITKSPSLTVAVSVTRGMRENNSCGDSEDVDKLMILSSLSSIAFSESSVGISFNKSTIFGRNVDLFELVAVEKEG